MILLVEVKGVGGCPVKVVRTTGKNLTEFTQRVTYISCAYGLRRCLQKNTILSTREY